MKVTFKLYANFSHFLPANAKGYAIKLEVSESTTAHQIIEQFKVPKEKDTPCIFKWGLRDPGRTRYQYLQ